MAHAAGGAGEERVQSRDGCSPPAVAPTPRLPSAQQRRGRESLFRVAARLLSLGQVLVEERPPLKPFRDLR
eukprot:6140040-Lingulodinium_polyedra.AAC.1